MLTKRVLFCYNKLLAVALIQLTLEDSLHELASSWWAPGQHSRLASLLVEAKTETNQDYYEVLGVQRDATKHEIHRAFRQLAKKYHPDRNKEKGAQDEFIKIFQAYETLSDEKKRQEYDQRSQQQSAFGGTGGGGGGAHNHWQANQQMPNFDINDFFKRYEDHFLRHQAYHQQAHHNNQHQQHQHQHNRFSFHGVDLEDLFQDIDDDEMQSFRVFDLHGDHQDHLQSIMSDHFGEGSTFFGSHLPHQIHDSIHQYQHHHAHHHHHNHNSDNGFRSQSCHTVTKQINGILMTQTSCG